MMDGWMIMNRKWIDTHATAVPADEAVHPVLGHLIRDMGYKKVYCASVKQLASVPIWEKQRILRCEECGGGSTRQ